MFFLKKPSLVKRGMHFNGIWLITDIVIHSPLLASYREVFMKNIKFTKFIGYGYLSAAFVMTFMVSYGYPS